jgi:hypothetical protein
MNEAETRAEHGDSALKAAGWGVAGEEAGRHDRGAAVVVAQTGPFWGCSVFPDCKGTRPIGQEGLH